MPIIRAERRKHCWVVIIAVVVTAGLPRFAGGQVVINEFLFRDPDSRLEFVEIINASSRAIDLVEFQLSDERRAPRAIIDQPYLVAPGEFAVIVRDTSAFDARFSARRLEAASWPALNNAGDGAILWHHGSAVDSVFFDDSWGAYGQSIERIDPAAPSAARENWAPSVDPSGGTPGRRNSVYLPDRLPPTIVEAEEWIDGHVILYMSEPAGADALAWATIRFASGDRPLRASLSADRTQILLEPWSGADVAAVTVDGLSDASGNRMGTQTMTIARQPRPADLIINEILFEPARDPFDGLPDQQEFVELQSRASYPVALRGLYLTGRVSETGTGDTLRSTSGPLRIHSGGFAYFHARGSDLQAFRAAFPSAPPDSVSAPIPLRRESLLLDNNGDAVRLNAADNRLLDAVEYMSSWHLPELGDTRGVSIERITAAAASGNPANWTSSVSPEGGTPGRTNSVALPRGPTAEYPVIVSPSPFSPDGDGWHDFARIELETGRPSSTIAAWIFDAAGRLVRRVADALPVGPSSSLVWDGRDDALRELPTGVFIVFVESVDTAVGDVRRFRVPVVLVRGR